MNTKTFLIKSKDETMAELDILLNCLNNLIRKNSISKISYDNLNIAIHALKTQIRNSLLGLFSNISVADIFCYCTLEEVFIL